jgi:hypothetical protein
MRDLKMLQCSNAVLSLIRAQKWIFPGRHPNHPVPGATGEGPWGAFTRSSTKLVLQSCTLECGPAPSSRQAVQALR